MGHPMFQKPLCFSLEVVHWSLGRRVAHKEKPELDIRSNSGNISLQSSNLEKDRAPNIVYTDPFAVFTVHICDIGVIAVKRIEFTN